MEGKISYIYSILTRIKTNVNDKSIKQRQRSKMKSSPRADARGEQTVEKAVRPQGIKDKETNIKNSHAGNKHKAFIENALCFLAFSVFALWRTPVRRRMQKRKIYLPFSTSASVSRLSRHADLPERMLGERSLFGILILGEYTLNVASRDILVVTGNDSLRKVILHHL